MNNLILKGLEYQLMDYVKVSKDSCNSFRWQAPKVVIYFSEDVGEEVKQEIIDLGGHVANTSPYLI